jgi:hypothetical protein
MIVLYAANLLIHFRDLLPLELPGIPSIGRACLQPYTIIKASCYQCKAATATTART